MMYVRILLEQFLLTPVLLSLADVGLVAALGSGLTSVVKLLGHSTISSDGAVTFIGTYAPITYEEGAAERSVLFLGGGSKLYYPDGAAETTIKAQRAYFQLDDGITAGAPADTESPVRAFVLNFGDEASGITTTNDTNGADAWYDIQGRRLTGKPSHAGVYINNGSKVVIK